MDAPKPPKHLSKHAKRHWDRLVREYELAPDAALILQLGLENWDMAQQARQLIREQGLILNGRRHPAAEIQKNGDALFMRAMRELGLNLSGPGDVGRPPASLN